MGTLWNVDNTGNLDTGTIYTRDGTAIRQNVLPLIKTTSNSITGALNTEYDIFSNTNWTFTMPSGAAQGDVIKITSNFVGGTIQIPALQLVSGANSATTLGGTMTTTDNPASIELHASINVGATEWTAVNVTGNWLCSGSPNNFYINGVYGTLPELKVSGVITSTNTTPSTTINNGAIITDGGIGVDGNLNARGIGLNTQANGAIGTVTMTAGSALVLNTAIDANSYPVAISIDNGVVGSLRISSITVGAGFTIDSSLGSDAGQVFWFVLRQV